MSHYILTILAMMIILVSAGCKHRWKENTPAATSANVRIDFDWNGYSEIPPGVNIIFYPIIDSSSKESDYSGAPIRHQIQFDGGKVSLPVGRYNVIFYNDYTSNILFSGMDSFSTAEAFLDEYNRAPLAYRVPSLQNVSAPDVFYSAHLENYTVNPTNSIDTIKVKPTLHTLHLHFHVPVEGIYNVSMADGSITGAARGISLSTGMATGDVSKRIFSFSLKNDKMETTTSMFLFDYPPANTFNVELAFLLRDNSVAIGDFRYDVTDQIADALSSYGGSIPPDGIHITISGIKIDDVEGGGFSAAIDGWDDNVNIELK